MDYDKIYKVNKLLIPGYRVEMVKREKERKLNYVAYHKISKSSGLSKTSYDERPFI